MKALKYDPTEIDIDITDISLLTAEEAEKLPTRIGEYGDFWWLSSHGHSSNFAAAVTPNDIIEDYGFPIHYDVFGVRPVLTISNVRFTIGDIIKIQNKKYIAIAPNKVLYNDEVVPHRFDEETNDYEKSEIKKIVDNWISKDDNRRN